MRAYLQAGMHGVMNFETMQYGLEQLGYEIYIIAEPGQCSEVEDTTVFYGNVNFIKHLLEDYLEYKVPKMGYVPSSLIKFAGRGIRVMTLKDALAYIKVRGPHFIKPIEANQKYFTGKVIKSLPDLDIIGYPNDAMVYISNVVEIQSEWRGFVLDGELVAIRHYKGNFRVHPSYKKIDKMIAAWKDQPVAWSCDVGIFENGHTHCIECNDVMSLGLYGVEPIIAARMLIERWAQIHKQNCHELSGQPSNPPI